MLQESDIIPYHLSHPPGERAIVLAPHPDDETLGCGGTIRLLLKSKRAIKVIFLTSGDKADPSNKLSRIKNKVMVQTPSPLTPSRQGRGELFLVPSPLTGEGKGGGELLQNKKEFMSKSNTESDQNNPAESTDISDIKSRFSDDSHITEYALLREKEAVRALKVLGVSDYEFLRFPDRELEIYYKDALESLLEIVRTYMPDTIYSPSMIEINPDHRTTAKLAMDIQKLKSNNMNLITIVFYEVTTPLRPNILVDITDMFDVKKKAIKKYKSQLKLLDYLRHITALNAMRALTVQNARHVEAFWCVDKPLNSEDIIKWLSYQRAIFEHLPC